ncbi:MAG TPA: chemotaxis protein CheW, partial [Candidatus Xenobia bacterium]
HKTSLGGLYRSFHSIRATCQFFAFPRIEALAGAVEAFLLPYRDAPRPLSNRDDVAATMPALRSMLQRLATSGREGEDDISGLLAAFQTPTEKPSDQPTEKPAPPRPAVAPELLEDFLVESREALAHVEQDLVALEQSPADGDRIARIFRACHTLKGSCGFLGFPFLQAVTHSGETLLGRLRDGSRTFDSSIASVLLALVDRTRSVLQRIESQGDEGSAPHTDLVQKLTELTAGPAASTVAPQPAAPRHDPVDTGLRVDVNVLDRLMTVVGELVLTRHQWVQATQGRDDLLSLAQRFSRLTGELQDAVLQTRLQPLATLWGKLPRVVRDVAATTQKQVRLSLEGQDTELDRALIEAIKDPLMHMVRNAIDHGIEPPAERKKLGKPEAGQLQVRAWHQAGRVHVDVADDGRGVDVERVRQKAAERGLLTAEQAAALSQKQAVNLIMMPGFSTAPQITEVSGRGVGMDVVKTNVDQIGGTVEIDTHLGQGTTIRITLPLTLAIMSALMVRACGQRFALPEASLREVVGASDMHGVEWFHAAPVYRLRDTLVPIVSLERELNLSSEPLPTRFDLIVLQVETHVFALAVSAALDREEIVVKPLNPWIASVTVYAGSAIGADGRPVLILDVPGLATRARALSARPAPFAAPVERPLQEAWLMVRNAIGERFVMTLSQVVRLECFPSSRIERSGGQVVVQYQRGILPLVDLHVLRGAERDEVNCVICSIEGRGLGVLVDQVLDIVHDQPQVTAPATRRGVTARAVVADRVVELLDAAELLRQAYPIA